MRMILVILGVLALLLALAWWGGLLEKAPTSIEAARVERGEVRETVSSVSAGTVEPHREAEVAALVAGRVAEIAAREGVSVRAAMPVVRLDDDVASLEVAVARAAVETARSRITQAEARLALAEARLARAVALEGPAAPSAESVETLRTERDVAREETLAAGRQRDELVRRAELAEAQLERTRITAPFDGVIRDLEVEVGEYVAPGVPLFRIMDESEKYVEAPIDEVDRPRVRTGQTVAITLQAYPGRVIEGTVREIAPAVSTDREQNRTAWVRVTLPPDAADLATGLSADLEIIVAGVAGVLRVPSHAVHEARRGEEGTHYVYVVEGGHARRRGVEVGLQNWDFTEIRSGLAAGDLVITSLDVLGLEKEPEVEASGAAAGSVAAETRRP